jgi:DNA polymerase IIIc chi subunit
MKPEINFYQIDESLVKSLAPLLLKVLSENKKALVFCKNIEQIKDIDGSLWSYGRNKFIPHITILDKDFELNRQPIFLSNEEKNSNNANYLVFLDEPSKAFMEGFERVFYFFAESNFDEAKSLAAKLKPQNCYKKQDAKWVKFVF